MKNAIEWWTFMHSSQTFTHQSLPIARQCDDHSCGLMAWNALAAYLCELVILVDPSNMEAERLQVLLGLIKVVTDMLGSESDGHGNGLGSDGYNEGDELSSESSDGYDEGDELDSDGSVNSTSFGGEDVEMLDGNKTCSLPCSDLSEQEARNNPPHTKTSSIRNALEIAAKDPMSTPKAGILKYFKKATEDKIREQRLREKDQWECTQQNNEYLEQVARFYQQNRKRELAKKHQQRHEMKKKQLEIEARIRSPGGTKRKVCNNLIELRFFVTYFMM